MLEHFRRLLFIPLVIYLLLWGARVRARGTLGLVVAATLCLVILALAWDDWPSRKA